MGITSDIIEAGIDAYEQEQTYKSREKREQFEREIDDQLKRLRIEIEEKEESERAESQNSEEDEDDLLSPSKTVFCDGCGEIFDKEQMRKCKRCGKVLCPSCRTNHTCLPKDIKELKAKKNDKRRKSVAERLADEYTRKEHERLANMWYNRAVYNETNVRGPSGLAAALPDYISAAKYNHGMAMYRLGLCFMNGEVVQKNDYEATFWLNRAVAKNSELEKKVAVRLFTYYAKSDAVRNFATIERWYQKISKSSDWTDSDKKLMHDILCMCYYKYGEACFKGDNIPKNLQLAVKHLTSSEEGDDIENDDISFHKDISFIGDVQYQYAAACEEKEIQEGNSGNYIQAALAWYQKATKNKCAKAALHLGVMFEEGKLVLQDLKNAVKYYAMASELGDSEAQYRLGLCYHVGKGVPQNIMKVKQLLKNAVEQDNEEALQYLTEHPELCADGPTHVTYNAQGDIIQGNLGIIAKDDGVVNRASVTSIEQQEVCNPEQQEGVPGFKFCMYCGTKLPSEALFCMKCGKKQ